MRYWQGVAVVQTNEEGQVQLLCDNNNDHDHNYNNTLSKSNILSVYRYLKTVEDFKIFLPYN